MIKSVRLVLQVETDEGEKFEGATMPFSPKIVDIEDARVFSALNGEHGLPPRPVEDLLAFTVRSLRESVPKEGPLKGKDIVDFCLSRAQEAMPFRLKSMSFDELGKLSPYF